MHWSASAPVTWPSDEDWQTAWRTGVDDVVQSIAVADDGTLRVEGDSPTDPSVQLTAGTHLQPGAAYRISPDLTTGVLRGWVADGRAFGVEWAPGNEPGRAHVEVQGLDAIREARAESTLRYVSGRGRLSLRDPGDLLDAEVTLGWLHASVTARVRSGHLVVDLHASGRGAWRLAIAPVMRAASRSVATGLQQSVDDYAKGITQLPVTGTLEVEAEHESLADKQYRHTQDVRAGVEELSRRQHLVLDTVEALPWWRRTRSRWSAEVAALPPGIWPDQHALQYGDWPSEEARLSALVAQLPRAHRAERLDTVVTAYGETLVKRIVDWDKTIDDIDHHRTTTAATGPWLNDQAMDLSWLASPWTAVKRGRSMVV